MAHRHSSITLAVQHSYDEVAKSPTHLVPLTGANCIHVGSRKDRVSVLKRILFPRVSIFQRFEPNVHEERHKVSEEEMVLGVC
jgi:hypothetical protein